MLGNYMLFFLFSFSLKKKTFEWMQMVIAVLPKRRI